MKSVLLIAFHFPPVASSGTLRSLKFAKYLPKSGWRPTVLTAWPSAFERAEPALLSQIPTDITVHRAFALDAKRHLGIRGIYLPLLAIPDRWGSWTLGAMLKSFAILRSHTDVIFTTFPIATAVLIGLIFKLMTRKPWVIDFRDSMTEDNYPPQRIAWRIYRWLERQAMRRGSLFIFTAASARRMYLERYPFVPPANCVVIPNGYDEEDFAGLKNATVAGSGQQRLKLLHMGLLYPEERDPRPFLRALARLRTAGKIDSTTLAVNLRHSKYEDFYSHILRELGIEDIVHLLPRLPYREALQEGTESDALLLFQAANSNHQIPAKTYEYLRLQKPILALTPAGGDTAHLLEEVGGATVVDIASEEAIYELLPKFLAMVRSQSHPRPDLTKVRAYSRQVQTQDLARRLEALVS